MQLEKTEWLKQPIIYSMVHGDFTNMQTTIMIQMLTGLQDKFNRYIEKTANLKPKPQLELFPQENVARDVLYFTIPLNSVCSPDQYDELELSCKKLAEMSVIYTAFEEGELRRHFSPIFADISIPRYDSDNRRKGYLSLSMLRITAEAVFDMRKGYINVLPLIASKSKKKPTPRLYIYLKVFAFKGDAVVSYNDLREYLWVYVKDNSGTVIKDSYPRYAKFKERILETAQSEMKQLFDEGGSDIWFDYEPVYPGTRRTGNPDKIRFIIHTVQNRHNLENPIGARDGSLEKQQHELADYLRATYAIGNADAYALFSLVTPTMWTSFGRACKQLRTKVKKYTQEGDNLTAYALTSLRNWIETHTPAATDADSGQPLQVEELPKTDAELSRQNQNWQKFLNTIGAKLAARDYATWIDPLLLHADPPGLVTITAPSSVFIEILYSKQPRVVNAITQAVQHVWGESTTYQLRPAI